jgi:O-antigen/teichoic acid export membrane protein
MTAMHRMIVRTLVTNSGTSVLGLMNAILLSRWLGPAGRGEIAAAFLWPGLLIYLGSMGLIISTMYFSSQPRAHVPLILNNSIALGLLLGALAAAFGFFAMPWLLRSQSPSVVSASRWYVLVIPVSLLAQFGLGVLQGRLHLKAVNWLNTIIPSGYLLGTIVLMYTGKLVLINVVALHLVLNLLVLVFTFVALARFGFYPGIKTDTALAKSMLGYGAKLHVGQLSGYANLNLDQALIAAFLPPAALGFYVVAVSSAGISLMLSSAVQTVTTPAIAREESLEAQRKLFERAFNRYWWLSLLLMLALGVCLPIVIPAVYGPSFRSSIAPAEVLLLGTLFMGARLLLSGGAIALGDPWLVSKASLLALPVTVLLLCLLLPTWGLMGAALASTLAYFVELAVVVYGCRRKHAISLSNLFRLRLDSSAAAPIQSGLARLAERS